ncbi:hypothetical protein ACLB2K_026098 [Fragaria x ananassa]
MRHRRGLPRHHPYRRQAAAFDNTIEEYLAPVPLTREEVLARVEGLNYEFGKREESTPRVRIVDDQDRPCWKKKSVFFQLEYWKDIPVRHNLDVMHIEKNCCDSIIGTLLNIPGKTKDGVVARLDMVAMGIRTELLPDVSGKRTKLPLASWNCQNEKGAESAGEKARGVRCRDERGVCWRDGRGVRWREGTRSPLARRHAVSHPRTHSAVTRYYPLWARRPSRFCFRQLRSSFPVDHPSWDCSRIIMLNLGVLIPSEAAEPPKGLMLDWSWREGTRSLLARWARSLLVRRRAESASEMGANSSFEMALGVRWRDGHGVRWRRKISPSMKTAEFERQEATVAKKERQRWRRRRGRGKTANGCQR